MAIGNAIKAPAWLSVEHGTIYREERESIQASKASLADACRPITKDYLVAEMKFGFWTSLLNARYDRLWHKIIGDVFPNMPRSKRTRGDASVLMNGVRKLRNAALHHHSIWHWNDLTERHAEIRNIIGYMCNSNSEIAVHVDRFPQIHSVGLGDCQKMVAKIMAR